MDCRVLPRKHPVSCQGKKGGKWGHDSLICHWVLPGAPCHIFTKSNMLFFLWVNSWVPMTLSPTAKKPKTNKKNIPKQICSMTVMNKIMEKTLSHLFSVHLLCAFLSNFDNVIFTFFSKLGCFLSSWGRKVYANQA